MVECLKQGRISGAILIYGASGDMPAQRGEQSLAGERLWNGSKRHKFAAIAQPRAISSASVLNCQMCHAGRRMLE